MDSNENIKKKRSIVIPIIIILLGIILISITIFTIKTHLQKMEENDPNNKSNKDIIFETASIYLDATKNSDRNRMKKYLLRCMNEDNSDLCNTQVDLDIDHIDLVQNKSTTLLKVDKKNIKIYEGNKAAEVTIETDYTSIIIYLKKENKEWYIDYMN